MRSVTRHGVWIGNGFNGLLHTATTCNHIRFADSRTKYVHSDVSSSVVAW
jgi:hypothetical protein